MYITDGYLCARVGATFGVFWPLRPPQFASSPPRCRLSGQDWENWVMEWHWATRLLRSVLAPSKAGPWAKFLVVRPNEWYLVPSILVASTLEVSKTRISKPLLYTVGPGHFAVSWFFRMVWPKKATPLSLKCDLACQVPPISNFVLNGRKDQSDEAQPTGNRAWNKWI